jgi:transposase-like protein
MPALDLTRQRFGRLVALSPGERSKWNQTTWDCICDCGNATTATTAALRSGAKLSCGCLRREAALAASKSPGAAGRRPALGYASICEAARALGVSESTVRTRLLGLDKAAVQIALESMRGGRRRIAQEALDGIRWLLKRADDPREKEILIKAEQALSHLSPRTAK